MDVREDCRHYLARTIGSGEVVRRCRVGAAAENPFACPPDCLFFEARMAGAGWAQPPPQAMSNTADGLIGLPPPKRRRKGKGKR